MNWSHCARLALLVFALASSAGNAKPPASNTPAPASAASQQGQSNPPQTPQAPPPSTASFESQILAYGAANQIAGTIADKVCAALDKLAPKPTKVSDSIVIYDQTAFATLMAYSAFVQNAEAVEGAYKTLVVANKSGNGTVGTAAGSGGTSISYSPASDLAGLLQAVAVSANSETYGTVTIPDGVIAIAVTRELRTRDTCKDLPIVYPPLFGQGSYSDLAASDIEATVTAVNNARLEAHKLVDDQLKTPTSLGNPASPTYFSTALADIDGLYDNFMNSLLQPNASTGMLGSANAVQGKALSDLLHGNVAKSRNPSYVLLATVFAAGGTVHDHKTFWTALSSGDVITFSGGAIVGVCLWQASSTPGALSPPPLYADVLNVRTDFVSANKIAAH